MFTVEQNGDNRLDLAFSGKLDNETMKAGLDDLLIKAEGLEHGVMLYRVGNFDLPTFGAIGVEFSRIPALFKLMLKFDKVAVVAGQHWLRVISQVEGALIPGLEVKAFELDKEADAEAWLSGS